MIGYQLVRKLNLQMEFIKNIICEANT